MRIFSLLASLSIASLMVSCNSNEMVTTHQRIPVSSSSQNYISNRAPLEREQFIKLPTGSIQPSGWLLKQLQLQRDGLNGHLMEISSWLDKSDNAWLREGGSWGWEEVPYWLRGYASLSFALEDEDMLKEAKIWIESILASQKEDGDFGPSSTGNVKATVMNPGSKDVQDFWPNMIVLWILQDYYEYTGDERIIPVMTRY